VIKVPPEPMLRWQKRRCDRCGATQECWDKGDKKANCWHRLTETPWCNCFAMAETLNSIILWGEGTLAIWEERRIFGEGC